MKTIMNNQLGFIHKSIIHKGVRLFIKIAPLLAVVMFLGSPSQAATQHIVESGETLSDIATRYKISQTALIDANGLMAIDMKAGQLLQIPDKDQRHNLYRVQSGDSIDSLSKRYKIDSSDLARANNLSIKSRLPTNSTLIIPARNKR